MLEAQTIAEANRTVCRVPVLTPWLEPFHCWFYPILGYLDWSSPKNTHTHMFIGAHMVKHAKAIKQKPYMVLYYLRVAIHNGWSHSQLCAVCHNPHCLGDTDSDTSCPALHQVVSHKTHSSLTPKTEEPFKSDHCDSTRQHCSLVTTNMVHFHGGRHWASKDSCKNPRRILGMGPPTLGRAYHGIMDITEISWISWDIIYI